MGQCGCEPTSIGRLKAPGRKAWYVLEVYPGCTDCGTDWGLGVVGVEERSAEWEFYEDAPELKLDDRYGFAHWGTIILSTRALQQAFQRESGFEEDDEAPFALEEFIQRGGLIDVFRESRTPEQQSPEPNPGPREGET